MSYQTRHPEAAAHPLRSIPMFRPASFFGAAFMTKQDPLTVARQTAARTLELARFESADELYPNLGDAVIRRRSVLACW